jgi:anti-sigma regulatory factor (Ser/Thr protein kinase)
MLMTRGAELTDFCLVLTATQSAAGRASEAIRKRFTMLTEETRRELAAVVTGLVENSVKHGPGKPITVTIALDADAIRGEVYDQGDLVPFEMPLTQ